MLKTPVQCQSPWFFCSLKKHRVHDSINTIVKPHIVHLILRGPNPSCQLQSSLLWLLCTWGSLKYTFEKLIKVRSLIASPVWLSTLGLTLDTGRWSEKVGICTMHSSYNMNLSVVCRSWSLARSQQLAWALVSEVSSVQHFSRRKDVKIRINVGWVQVRIKHGCKESELWELLAWDELAFAGSEAWISRNMEMRWVCVMGDVGLRPAHRAKC